MENNVPFYIIFPINLNEIGVEKDLEKLEIKKKKQRSAPGRLGDFCQQQLIAFPAIFSLSVLIFTFPFITSFF